MKKVLCLLVSLALTLALLPIFGGVFAQETNTEWTDITHLINRTPPLGSWRINISVNYWELDTVQHLRAPFICDWHGERITSAANARLAFPYPTIDRYGRPPTFIYDDDSFFEDNFLLFFRLPGFNYEVIAIRDCGDVIDFVILGRQNRLIRPSPGAGDMLVIPLPEIGFEIPNSFLGREFSVTRYTEITRASLYAEEVFGEWVERNVEHWGMVEHWVERTVEHWEVLEQWVELNGERINDIPDYIQYRLNQVRSPSFSFSNDRLTPYHSTIGSDIFYTIDGTIPTRESRLYTGREIELTRDIETVKIIAVKDGMRDSNIMVIGREDVGFRGQYRWGVIDVISTESIATPNDNQDENNNNNAGNNIVANDNEDVIVRNEEELPLQACDCGEICVLLDGEKLEFDILPTIVDDRVFVPFRAIFEALGMEVDWNAQTQMASGARPGLIIEIPIDSSIALVNRNPIGLDVAAMLYNERTFVPLRFIAEASGAEVEWCDDTQMVLVSTNL